MINEKVVGTLSADQLASGIILAMLETPMLDQSRLVAFDTERKNEIDTVRYGLIQQPMDAIWGASPKRQDAVNRLSESHVRAIEQQRKDVQPVLHCYALVQ